jgi:YesN/AraC family two-component response regulator
MLKTLIVDDTPNNRNTLRGLFRIHFPSMIVEEASDGKEAKEKVRSFQPHLILMDIRLPDVSGLELTKEIKIMNSNVVILILTGHDYPEYRNMAARTGADSFLVKGGASKEILAVIESFFPNAKESAHR